MYHIIKSGDSIFVWNEKTGKIFKKIFADYIFIKSDINQFLKFHQEAETIEKTKSKPDRLRE